MLVRLIILFLVLSSTLALWNSFKNVNLKNEFCNIDRKNFTNLKEAISDAEEFILNLTHKYNLPSLTFGLAVKGKIVYRNAWGHIDLENSKPASIGSRYRLCSISKTFTSVLINRLVEYSKLTYDTPIHSVLSEQDLPRKQWRHHQVNITIAQLLSHQSGLHATLDSDFDDIFISPNNTIMIHKFKDLPLLFEPGARFEYSNYGFQVLGAVVEAVTKKTFEENLKQLIHELNLPRTVVEDDSLIIDNRARFYRFVNNVHENLPTSIFDQGFFAEGYQAAGGLLSSVEDMLRYGQMMIDAYKGRPNAILSKKTVKEMWTPRVQIFGMPHWPNVTEEQHYGYGWFITNITDAGPYQFHMPHYVSHSGGLDGSTTWLILYPDHEIVGIALTNKGMILELEHIVRYAAENVYPFFA